LVRRCGGERASAVLEMDCWIAGRAGTSPKVNESVEKDD
jgi:hypothetical protein